MEAKVDVRKLQILNDRINQTIDALNQVRLSVHGLGHTGMSQFNPIQQQYGMPQGLYGQTPFQGLNDPTRFGLGQSPFGQQSLFGGGLGFQHSPFTPFQSPFVNPYLQQQLQPQNPFVNPYLGQVMNPWTSGQTGLTGSPWTQTGGVAGIGGGLFHSSPDVIDRQIAEVRASDPYRISQTFPFVIP